MKNLRIGAWIITLVALVTIIGPFVADWNETQTNRIKGIGFLPRSAESSSPKRLFAAKRAGPRIWQRLTKTIWCWITREFRRAN